MIPKSFKMYTVAIRQVGNSDKGIREITLAGLDKDSVRKLAVENHIDKDEEITNIFEIVNIF